jgi:multiple sugar transport system permease protein
MARTIQPNLVRVIVIYLLLAILAAVFVFPFVWMVSTSLKHGPDVYTPVPTLVPKDRKTGLIYATLDNYRYVLTNKDMKTAFFNSLIVAGIVVPLKLFLNALAAYAFARIPFPGRDKLFLVLLSSVMVPGIALLIPRLIVTRSLGMYDSLVGLIVPMSISVFDIFLLRQFFLSLPDELEEAAMVDGANRFRIFWQIILPLSTPVLAVVTITSFIWHWNDLTWPLVILNNPKLYTLPLSLAYLQGGMVNKPYYIMAGATISVIPVMIVFLIFQKKIIKGFAFTGLKG